MGSGVSVSERAKAAALARAIDDERGSKVSIEVHNEGDKDLDEFWKYLGGEGPIKPAAAAQSEAPFAKRLYRLSDESGSLKFDLVAEGKVSRSLLSSSDAFIFDVGPEIFGSFLKTVFISILGTILTSFKPNQHGSASKPLLKRESMLCNMLWTTQRQTTDQAIFLSAKSWMVLKTKCSTHSLTCRRTVTL